GVGGGRRSGYGCRRWMVSLTCSVGKGAVGAAVSPTAGGDASARVAAPVVWRNPRRVAMDRSLSKSFTTPPLRVFMCVQNDDRFLPAAVIDKHQPLIASYRPA